MNADRRRRPVLEALESRMVLSALTLPPRAAAAALVAAPRARATPLNGSLRIPIATSDESANLDSIPVAGSGTLRAIGAVSVLGTFSGAENTGNADLTIVTSRGNLRLLLTNPVLGGTAYRPRITMNLAVLGGTGAYANASGQGSALVLVNMAQSTPQGYTLNLNLQAALRTP